MEHLISEERSDQPLPAATSSTEMCPTCRTGTRQDELPCKECFQVTDEARNHNSHVRIPCGNGQMYSVSQNRIVYLPGNGNSSEESELVPSVKLRVSELESQTGLPNVESNLLTKKSHTDRKGLVLNLTSQFETSCSKSGSPTEAEKVADNADVKVANPPLLTAILVKEEIWDPGEKSEDCRDGQMWTSTSELLNGDNQLPVTDSKITRTRREGDPFSDKLDRVFDREERKQTKTVPVVASVLPPSVPENSTDGGSRESPSRQSSWSSYDSAVVLGYQGETREAPSRQSSWGSGDLRGPPGALPSRNSSWGSYDLRPAMQYVNERGEKNEESSSGMFPYDKEDIPWYPGTVKRTKQKLEEVSQTKDAAEEAEPPSPPRTEISACNLKFHGPKPYQTPVLSKDLKTFSSQLTEAIKPVLVHYASSPTLSTRPSLENNSSSTEKMTVSQPNMSLLEEEPFGLPRSGEEAPLSVSAPDSYSIGHLCEPQTQGPCVINTIQCQSVRQQKQVLESLTSKSCVLPKRCLSMDESVIANDLPKNDVETQKSVPGMVKNLKKEFEAKSVSKSDKSLVVSNDNCSDNSKQSPEKVRSVPSSPVSTHLEAQPNLNSSEDVSVKNLVGKYEIKKNQHNEDSRPRFVAETEMIASNKLQPPPPPNRKSSLEITPQPQLRMKNSLFLHNLKNSSGVLDRPPAKTPSPSVVVASVVAKAASKKQQQGKTHPLAHLTINPRHNNAVYNTM